VIVNLVRESFVAKMILSRVLLMNDKTFCELPYAYLIIIRYLMKCLKMNGT